MTLVINKVGSSRNPALIFLHGAGVSSWMWQPQVETLQDDFYCITVDLPGNGESFQSEWVSLTDSAAQVASIIRAETPHAKAHVVSLSLGSYVALKLLEHHADVVESVIVSGVSTRPLPNLWQYKLLIGIMQPMNKVPFLIDAQARMMGIPPDVIPLMRRDTQRMSTQTFQRIYDEVLTFNLPTALSQRTQRVLAAAGDSEVKAVLNGLADFRAGIPNGQTVIAPNAHHPWNGEHPELFTAMIRAWVCGEPLPTPLSVVASADDSTKVPIRIP
jgi:pimeloyl-ACP methyl ester carboxylesterase